MLTPITIPVLAGLPQCVAETDCIHERPRFRLGFFFSELAVHQYPTEPIPTPTDLLFPMRGTLSGPSARLERGTYMY